MFSKRTTQLAAIGAAAACMALAAAPASAAPPEMKVSVGGKSVVPTQGSSCWSQVDSSASGVTGCADSAYPLPLRCALPVKRGAKATVDAGAPASSLIARLVDGDGEVKRKLRLVSGSPGDQTWRFRLPRAARDSIAIDVFARYPSGPLGSGDSNAWAGLDTRACG